MNYAANPFEEPGASSLQSPNQAGLAARPQEGIDSLIDYQRLRTAILRNKFVIGYVVALALGIGALVTLFTTSLYTATASMIVNQQADRILDTEETTPAVSYADADRFLQTQVDILNSRRLALRVVEDEGLLDDPAFLEFADIVADDSLSPSAQQNQTRENAIAYLDENLAVSLPIESRLVTVSFTSPDRGYSSRIANAFVDVFIRDNLDRRAESSRYAKQYLSAQLAEAKLRLEASERELNDFAQSSGIVQVTTGTTDGSGDAQTVTGRSLLRLNDAASDAEALRAAAEARWRSAANIPASQLTEVVNNGAYQQLQTERTRIQSALNQELAIRRDGHPNVQSLRSQLDSVNEQLDQAAANIKQSIRSNYLVAQAQEAELKQRVAALQGDYLAEDGRGVEYGILAREVETNRALYDGLLQRFKEVGAEEGLASSNVSRVDEASPPILPSSPKPLLNMGLALVGGLFLAGMVTFLREVLDDIIRSPADVDERLGLRTLGTIPMPEDDDQTIMEAVLDPKSPVAEAMHSLRTSVSLTLRSHDTNVVLASSTQASEGKSTTMFALARDFSMLGKRTVLVDGDLRRASLHKMAGVPNTVGLTDLVAETASLDQVIQQLDQEYGFSFISSGSEVADPATVLNSDHLAEIFADLSRRYDIVLVDGPPVLGLADAPNLASKVGHVVFMMEAHSIHARNARAAVGRLAATGAKILGVTLTKLDFSTAGYGYEYSYAYS